MRVHNLSFLLPNQPIIFLRLSPPFCIFSVYRLVPKSVLQKKRKKRLVPKSKLILPRFYNIRCFGEVLMFQNISCFDIFKIF